MRLPVIIPWFLRLLGIEIYPPMPRYIFWKDYTPNSAPIEIFRVDSYRMRGLNRFGEGYVCSAVNSQKYRHCPFYREDPGWQPLSRKCFNTDAEYEMFLMLNPEISREELEQYDRKNN